MSILDKIRSIGFTFSPEQRKVFRRKSGIVWGNLSESNASFPLLYISKPKNISEEDFEEILSRLELNIMNKSK